MNTVGIGVSLRDAELPARLRINQHRHWKENLRVMLDWYDRAAQLYTAPPLCQEFFGGSLHSPPPHFLTETQDEFVHSFSSLIYWVLGERNEVYGNRGYVKQAKERRFCMGACPVLFFFSPFLRVCVSFCLSVWSLLYSISDSYLTWTRSEYTWICM